MKVVILRWVAAMVLCTVPLIVRADTIPYPDVGTVAPATSFTATSSGPVTAYFFGSNASYTSEVGILVNGVASGVFGLPNQSSSVGQSFALGNVNAGDTITFAFLVQNTGQTWYSNPALNSDGVNHVFATNFSGNSTVPAGVYLGLEDVAKGSADFDYNDDQVVVTGVKPFVAAVPEPASLSLFGMGLTGLVGVLRKKLKR